MKDSFSVVDGVCHLLVNVQGPYVRVAEGGKELTDPRSMVVLLKVADNDKQMPRSSATQDNSCFPGKTKNVACICGDSSKGGVRITPTLYSELLSRESGRRQTVIKMSQ